MLPITPHIKYVVRSLGTISEVNYIKSCQATDHHSTTMLNIVLSRYTRLCYNTKLTIEFICSILNLVFLNLFEVALYCVNKYFQT